MTVPALSVVCVSQAVRDFMHERAGIPLAQLRVIPNGVDLSRFATAADPKRRQAARTEVRREFGLRGEALVAVAVGRLEPQKGYEDLLEAWALLAGDASPAAAGAVLLVAGEGAERARLERRIATRGLADRVRLLGHREDVPRLLAAADVYVLSSRYEGFGLALVEALACGLPVVATAVDSVPEVLGEGRAGLLVPARDPAGLAAAVAWLLGLPPTERARLGEAARARAQEFPLRRMLDAYDALYRELAEQAARPRAASPARR